MSNKNTDNRKHNQQTNMKSQKHNDNRNISKTKQNVIEDKSNYHLIPIFIILCVIPLIVRLKMYNTHFSQFTWFDGVESDTQFDIFLYYKQWIFVFVSGVMALAVIVKTYYQRKKIHIIPVFIPLAVYAVWSLFSALLSEYAYYSFNGSLELYESVLALLGYCVVVYYVYLFINTERDFRLILYYLIGLALLMSLLGVFQFLGLDFFSSKLGYNLIMPNVYRGTELTFNFEAHRVFLTLFNPNYVGVYVALVLPVISVMLFFQKKIILILLYILSVIGLIICAIGAQSLGGVIGLGVAVVCIPIFMWRSIIKRYYIAIPVILLLLLGVILLNYFTDQLLVNKFKSALEIKKTEPALSDLHTEDDCVSLTYNGSIMKVRCNTDENGVISLTAYDSDNQLIKSNFDPSTEVYSILDERFPNFMLGWDSTNAGAFYILIEGKKWVFTNFSTDGTYYYISRFNRLDKMIKAPSALFTGYERFASGRGYIWSRTIPLLKKYIFLGSGSDTFTMAFPQRDYLGLYQYGYEGSIITKPHNMYLQMGVQTGILSLIAFLIFYFIYFISSIRLYIRGCFSSFYAKFGVAIFIGTVSYMVAGLGNDSNINTSPIFWTLMGVGIVLNIKAKPLILEEIAAVKAKKAEKLKAETLKAEA